MTASSAHERATDAPGIETGIAILAILPWLFPAGGEPVAALVGTLLVGAGSIALAATGPGPAPGRAASMASRLGAAVALVLLLDPSPGPSHAGLALAAAVSLPRVHASWRAAGAPARTWISFAVACAVGAAYAYGIHLWRVAADNPLQ